MSRSADAGPSAAGVRRERARGLPDLVSVVIPARNAAETIGAQLDALSRQTYRGDWELIVADNGSTDSTRDILRSGSRQLPLRIVDASQQRGASYARNVGVRSAHGDFLAFTDADDIATPSWLEAIVTAAAQGDVVGGWSNTEPLNDPIVKSWRATPPSDRLPTRHGYLPFAPSGSSGVWHDVWDALSGYREDYAAGEDVEFSWRAQLAGYQLVFAEDAEILYRHRSDLSALAHQSYAYAKSGQRLLVEYVPRTEWPSFWPAFARRVGWLLLRLPYLVISPRRRGIWVRVAAGAAGHLAGYRAWSGDEPSP